MLNKRSEYREDSLILGLFCVESIKAMFFARYKWGKPREVKRYKKDMFSMENTMSLVNRLKF